MSEKLITIAVPCYNSQSYMHKCIESLLVRPHLVDIIIINDGSTDNTGSIADEYCRKFPESVRVVHQENGGHGEGINQGMRLAVGKYFKVVDSDDWLDGDAFNALLDDMEAFESRSEYVDMIVCNYVYVGMHGEVNTRINFLNALPEGRVVGWRDVGHFRPWQYFTLHSCIFRTELMRQHWMELPKHTFYEDNLFASMALLHIKKLYYRSLDLYCYLIGREGQSVAYATMCKRACHQGLVSMRIFEVCDYTKADIRQLRKYLYHLNVFMLMLANIFLRFNGGSEAIKMRRNMWELVKSRKSSLRIRFFSLAAASNIPGRIGVFINKIGYELSKKVVKFN